MVRIIDYKASLNAKGKEFISLKLQGGIETVQSRETGRLYLTAKTCYISTTFSESVAMDLVGSELPGTVEKIACDPYAYTVKETGEVILLTHKYEYSADIDSPLVTRSEERKASY
jgi:hypothetical protein